MKRKAGDRLQLSADGDPCNAVLLIASENEDSLMVLLEDGFTGRLGGVYVNMMPLLRTDGVYRELIGGEAVDVHWIDAPR